jgi:hypothetical protein
MTRGIAAVAAASPSERRWVAASRVPPLPATSLQMPSSALTLRAAWPKQSRRASAFGTRANATRTACERCAGNNDPILRLAGCAGPSAKADATALLRLEGRVRTISVQSPYGAGPRRDHHRSVDQCRPSGQCAGICIRRSAPRLCPSGRVPRGGGTRPGPAGPTPARPVRLGRPRPLRSSRQGRCRDAIAVPHRRRCGEPAPGRPPGGGVWGRLAPMLVNLTALRWTGVYQEMMPKAQSAEALLAWRGCRRRSPAAGLPRCWRLDRGRTVPTGRADEARVPPSVTWPSVPLDHGQPPCRRALA